MKLINKLQLNRQDHIAIAVVGAGGKTSTVRKLCKEYNELGKKVIMTTSTHMLPDPELSFVECTDLNEVKRALDNEGVIHTGVLEPVKNGIQKVAAPDVNTASALYDMCDVLIVEADGAQMRCIKVPADWEPVIWDFIDVVIGVLGADAIGKQIEKVAYRPDDLANFLGKKIDDCIEISDIIRIATAENGLKKHVEDREFYFMLNKMDLVSNKPLVIELVEAIGGYCNSFL